MMKRDGGDVFSNIFERVENSEGWAKRSILTLRVRSVILREGVSRGANLSIRLQVVCQILGWI